MRRGGGHEPAVEDHIGGCSSVRESLWQWGTAGGKAVGEASGLTPVRGCLSRPTIDGVSMTSMQSLVCVLYRESMHI